MASVSRRIRRFLSGKSRQCPSFTQAEIDRLDRSTLAALEKRQAELKAPAPAPATAPAPAPKVEAPAPRALKTFKPAPPIKTDTSKAVPVPAPAAEADKPADASAPSCPVHDGVSRGTVWRPKSAKRGGPFGPFKNQTEARKALRAHFGVDRLPPGVFTRF